MPRSLQTALMLLALAGSLAAQAPQPTANASEPPLQQIRLTLHRGLVHRATTAQLDPRGIVMEDAVLTLFARDGRWPGARLGTPDGKLSRRLAVRELDVSSLTWDGQTLAGMVRAQMARRDPGRDMGEGENMHSMLKARRRPVIGWHIGGIQRVQFSPWTCELSAKRTPGRDIDLMLRGAVAGRDLQAQLHFDGQGQCTGGHALVWKWNHAMHEVDGSELTFRDGKLSGTLGIRLTPDPWVRPGTKGRPGPQLSFRLDARTNLGGLSGQYHRGRSKGELQGHAWEILKGRFTAHGVDGEISDTLTVHLSPARKVTVDDAQRGPIPEPPARPAHTPALEQAGYHSPTGRHFPQAQPPMDWDLQTGRNLRWKVAVGPGASPPAQAPEGKLLCMVEPNRLICLDADSGKTLWSVRCEPVDDAGPDRSLAAYRAALAGMEALEGQAHQARRQWKDLRKEDPAAAQQALSQYEQFVKQRDTLQKDWSDYAGKLAKTGLDVGDSLGRRASAVPVTKGKRVWASFGTGTVACYDLAGKQLWRTQTEMPFSGDTAFSPLLVGEVLYVPGTVLVPNRRRNDRAASLCALDADSGKLLWRSGPLGASAGVVAVVLGQADREPKVVLATPDGTLLDGKAGTVLHKRLNRYESPVVPTVDGDRVYLAGKLSGQLAIRLGVDSDGNVSVKTLWNINRVGWSSPQQTQPGLVHEGLWYLPRSSDENAGHHPVPWDQLDVYETQWGQHVARPNPVVFTAASPLPLARAGDVIAFSDSGTRGWGKPPKATITFLSAGDRPVILARHEMAEGKLAGSPVFDGERMYLRVDGELACVGTGTEQARREDLQAMARQAIGDIGPRPRLQVIDLSPDADYTPPDGVPVWQIQPNIPPEDWLMAGPFRHGRREAPQAPTDPGSLRPRPGTQVTLDGLSEKFGPLPKGVRVLRSLIRQYRSDRAYYQAAYGLDINVALKETDGTTAYFYTVIDVPRETTVRLRLDHGQAWLAGQKVPDRAPLRMKPGLYPMLYRVDVGRFPPVGRMVFAPHFNPILSPTEGMGAWRDKIRIRKGLLQRVAEELRAYREGRYAELLLAELEKETE